MGPPKPNVPSRRKYSRSSRIVHGTVSDPGSPELAAGSVAAFKFAGCSAIEAADCRTAVPEIQLWQLSVDRGYVCSISPSHGRRKQGAGARLAAAHPPDPAQAELLPSEDLAPVAAARGRRDQELGLRPAQQRAGARRPELGLARDRR